MYVIPLKTNLSSFNEIAKIARELIQLVSNACLSLVTVFNMKIQYRDLTLLGSIMRIKQILERSSNIVL